MKLLKLMLENFQGVKNFTFEPNGLNASVYGTNAAGKTTLYNAFTWLLFDKASAGEKGFSPKPKGTGGEDIHNLNTRVEGIFELDDGTTITLAKDLHEKWTKKRGNSAEEFTGNETDYFIDSVPVGKAEYTARLAEMYPADRVRVLTQPEYFSEALNWQNRRTILLEVCGDITDFDVINSSAELSKITGFLLKQGTGGQFYTVEEYQKMATAQRRDINSRLEQIPARIDEAAKAMPDITGIVASAVNDKICWLQSEADRLAEEKALLSETDSAQSARKAIAEIYAEISIKKNEFETAKNNALQGDRADYGKLIEKLRRARSGFDMQKYNIAQQEAVIKRLEDKRSGLSSEYAALKKSEYDGDTICPTCKQNLPIEKIEDAKSAFNKNKSAQLESIYSKIETECSKPMIVTAEWRLKELSDDLVIMQDNISAIEAELQILDEKIRAAEKPKFEDASEYAALTAKIAEIKANAESGTDNNAEAKQALQAKIEGLRADIEAERSKLLMLRTAEQQKARIETLEAEEKNLNREYEKLTEGLYLCEEFIKAKVRMLDDKINGKFTNVRFRLFETQINGGIKDDCEVMIPTPNGLVPFSTANNAARINAGLEITDTLARHWGMTMPVFVDNAESVVALQYISSQVIRLVVSELDATLRIEI